MGSLHHFSNQPRVCFASQMENSFYLHRDISHKFCKLGKSQWVAKSAPCLILMLEVKNHTEVSSFLTDCLSTLRQHVMLTANNLCEFLISLAGMQWDLVFNNV